MKKEMFLNENFLITIYSNLLYFIYPETAFALAHSSNTKSKNPTSLLVV